MKNKRMMAILLAVAMAVLPAGSSLADVSIGGKEEKKEISVHVATPGNADEKPEEDTELDDEDMRDEAGDEDMTDEASGGQVATPSNASMLNMKAAVSGDFEYEVDGDGIRITKYTGTDTDVVIPDEIDGKPVKTIENSAFTSIWKLESIYIPDSVTSIGDLSFFGCNKLRKISGGKGIVTIGNRAFGTNGYYEKIPTLLGSDNGILKNHDWNSENRYLVEKIGIFENAFEYAELSGEDSIIIIKYIGTEKNVVVPDKIEGKPVTSIGDGAFSVLEIKPDDNNVGVNSVSLPTSLIYIGKESFGSNHNLKSINIPNGVKEIGENAFTGCQSLTEITLPSSLDVIQSGTFWDCKGLTKVKLPSDLKSIDNNAFVFCENLKSIDIPDSVTEIGDDAFAWCKTLSEVRLPSNLSSISDGILKGSTINKIDIPEGVTSIGCQAFAFTNLTSITIPDSVTTFWSEDNGEGIPDEPLGESPGYGPFYQCNNLETINGGNGLTEIGYGSFYNSSGTWKLTKLNTNNSLLLNYGWARDKRYLEGSTPPDDNPTNNGSNGGGGGSSGGGSSHSGGSSSGGGSPRVTSTTAPPDTMSGTWQRNERGWWFTKSDGSYATNEWGRLKGKWYYFGPDGYMQTGWQLINGQWYYLNPSQADEGAMSTGWVLDPVTNRWFYLNGDGAMQTGWQNIDGKWYYLNPVSDGTQGTMLTDTWVDGYYVNADGVWTGQQ